MNKHIETLVTVFLMMYVNARPQSVFVLNGFHKGQKYGDA